MISPCCSQVWFYNSRAHRQQTETGKSDLLFHHGRRRPCSYFYLYGKATKLFFTLSLIWIHYGWIVIDQHQDLNTLWRFIFTLRQGSSRAALIPRFYERNLILCGAFTETIEQTCVFNGTEWNYSCPCPTGNDWRLGLNCIHCRSITITLENTLRALVVSFPLPWHRPSVTAAQSQHGEALVSDLKPDCDIWTLLFKGSSALLKTCILFKLNVVFFFSQCLSWANWS